VFAVSGGLGVYVIDTSYGQFTLSTANASPVPDTHGKMGLLQVVDNDTSAVIFTGIRDGKVEVRIASNPADGSGSFEEEEQGLLQITEPLWLDSPTVDIDLPDPVVVPEKLGPHHIRVRARGRSEHEDESVLGRKPVEWYEVAIWPASGQNIAGVGEGTG
jgi:hypothetical protein